MLRNPTNLILHRNGFFIYLNGKTPVKPRGLTQTASMFEETTVTYGRPWFRVPELFSSCD